MSFFSKTLKKLESTQMLSTGLSIETLLKPTILKELRGKFGKGYKVYVSSVTFRITLPNKRISTLTLEHQSEEQLKGKITAITSDNVATLKKFVK